MPTMSDKGLDRFSCQSFSMEKNVMCFYFCCPHIHTYTIHKKVFGWDYSLWGYQMRVSRVRRVQYIPVGCPQAIGQTRILTYSLERKNNPITFFIHS